MEFSILLAVIVCYFSLSSKISKITNNMLVRKNKNFPSLKELIGKNIELETDDYFDTYGYQTKGILKKYNDTWIVLEVVNKKNKKELYYYRLNNIISINIVDK